MAAASSQDVPNDGSQPSIDSPAFLRDGVDIRVSNREGFLCKVRMKALIDLPPKEMYDLLTHADNSAIFKSIDVVSDRRVHLDTPERKEVYVEQTSTVGVLFFKRQFTTALNVVELPAEMSASFGLAKPGVMAAFQGSWQLESVPTEQYSDLIENRVRAHHWIRSLDKPSAQDKTLFSIDQDVAPAIAQKVPPWLHGLLRRICAAAVNDVYQDMTVVAELRHRGVPMEEILQSKIHGRGGLIRSVLCVKPKADPSSPTATLAPGSADKAVGSHMVNVRAIADSDTSSEIAEQHGEVPA
eukprot:jgi/Ulvmu1/9923/UM058_0005.1